jgi:hypothetical protein
MKFKCFFFNWTKLADTLSRIINLLALKPYTFLTLAFDAESVLFVFIGQKSGAKHTRSNQLMHNTSKIDRTVMAPTGAKGNDKQ